MARRGTRRALGIALAAAAAIWDGAAAAPGTVRGRIVDLSGAGLPAFVLVLSGDDRLVSRHETGPDGSFEFEVHEFPVQIVPHRGRPSGWEFEPRATRVAGPLDGLDFTGLQREPPLLRGRLVDAATGEPLGGAPVIVRRGCAAGALDPAASYRQPAVATVRANGAGEFVVPCSPDCNATLVFRGDADHRSATSTVEAGTCSEPQRILVEPR